MSLEDSETTVLKEKRNKHKEKKSHRQDGDSAHNLILEPGSGSLNIEAKKEKKSKRKKEQDKLPDADAVLEETPEAATTDATGKKKKKRKHSEAIEDPVSESQTKKKRRKDKEVTLDTENNEDQGVEEIRVKEKKSKKKERRTGDDTLEVVKPKKKRKHKDDSLLNPADDASLGGQALKALSYAYTQFADSASWKFNKARQNWLIRNLWSAEAIPDTHLPLLLKYLTGVKGGVRDALQKSCQEILQPPAESSKEASPKKKVSFAADLEDAKDEAEAEKEEKAPVKASAADTQELALRTSRATQVLQSLSATTSLH